MFISRLAHATAGFTLSVCSYLLMRVYSAPQRVVRVHRDADTVDFYAGHVESTRIVHTSPRGRSSWNRCAARSSDSTESLTRP